MHNNNVIIGKYKMNSHFLKYRNKFINQIRVPGGHIQLMIQTQQQYIKLNIHSEVSIIVMQAHWGSKKDI